MQDPIQRHPTRAEQLDILVSVLADICPQGGRVLDLGCGTGYVAWLLLTRRPDLHVVGVDMKAESLQAAAASLGVFDGRFTPVVGDLRRIEDLSPPRAPYEAALTALTFHDLDDAAKQRVIGAVTGWLRPGGAFLLYDRVRLAEPAAFALQQSLWRRIERVHGTAMRGAPDFAAYERDLGSDNRPAALADYFAWLPAAGLRPALLHLHGNVMLMAGVRAAGDATIQR